jgi:hypothetical protein
LGDRAAIGRTALAAHLDVDEERLGDLAAMLALRGLVAEEGGSLRLTGGGHVAMAQLVEAGRCELAALLEHWDRPDGQELAPVLRRLADSLVAEIPDEEPEPLRR